MGDEKNNTSSMAIVGAVLESVPMKMISRKLYYNYMEMTIPVYKDIPSRTQRDGYIHCPIYDNVETIRFFNPEDNQKRIERYIIKNKVRLNKVVGEILKDSLQVEIVNFDLREWKNHRVKAKKLDMVNIALDSLVARERETLSPIEFVLRRSIVNLVNPEEYKKDLEVLDFIRKKEAEKLSEACRIENAVYYKTNDEEVKKYCNLVLYLKDAFGLPLNSESLVLQMIFFKHKIDEKQYVMLLCENKEVHSVVVANSENRYYKEAVKIYVSTKKKMPFVSLDVALNFQGFEDARKQFVNI